MRIDYLGNVGIGTPSPAAKLHVAGDVLGDNLWVRVATAALSGAASYNFNGLDGNSQRMYKIYIKGLLSAAAANRCVTIKPNGINTVSYTNMAHHSGVESTVAWYNSAGAFDCGMDGTWQLGGFVLGNSDWLADGNYMIDAELMAQTGELRTIQSRGTFKVSGLAKVMHGDWYGFWNDTVTNITSLLLEFNGGTFSGQVYIFAQR